MLECIGDLGYEFKGIRFSRFFISHAQVGEITLTKQAKTVFTFSVALLNLSFFRLL